MMISVSRILNHNKEKDLSDRRDPFLCGREAGSGNENGSEIGESIRKTKKHLLLKQCYVIVISDNKTLL